MWHAIIDEGLKIWTIVKLSCRGTTSVATVGRRTILCNSSLVRTIQSRSRGLLASANLARLKKTSILAQSSWRRVHASHQYRSTGRTSCLNNLILCPNSVYWLPKEWETEQFWLYFPYSDVQFMLQSAIFRKDGTQICELPYMDQGPAVQSDRTSPVEGQTATSILSFWQIYLVFSQMGPVIFCRCWRESSSPRRDVPTDARWSA